MSVDTNNTELKKGADLATIADQRDDQRQQAEAEAAQEVLQRMQDTAAEDEKRRAHEEAEAKRKAEWEQKQREKAEAVLRDEIGIVFSHVLQNAGVFKQDAAGQAAFLKFMESVGYRKA